VTTCFSEHAFYRLLSDPPSRAMRSFICSPIQTRSGILLPASAEAQSAGFVNANVVPAKKHMSKKLSTNTGTIKNRITAGHLRSQITVATKTRHGEVRKKESEHEKAGACGGRSDPARQLIRDKKQESRTKIVNRI